MEQIKLFGKYPRNTIEERVNSFICELGPEVKIIDICYKHPGSDSDYSAMVRYNDPVLDYWVEKLKEVCHQTSDECSPGLMGAENKGFIVAKGDRIGDFVKGYLLRHMKCRSGCVSRTDWKYGESPQYNYDKYWEEIQEMAAVETPNCLIITVDDPKLLCNMCGYFLQLVKHEKPLISKHGKEYIFDGFVVIVIEKLDEVVKYAAEHSVAEFEELTTYYKMLG